MDEQTKSEYKPQSSARKVLLILAIALAIPITVTVVQQRQDIRQRASEPVPQDKPQAVTLGGYIYTDSNINGIRDVNENPATNVQVQISQSVPNHGTNSQGANQEVVLATIPTDKNGYFTYSTPPEYNLQNLLFTVRVVLPVGSKSTTPNPVLINAHANKPMEFGIVSTTPISITPSVTPKVVRTFPPVLKPSPQSTK